MNYFYGLAANPFTKAHAYIIAKRLYSSVEPSNIYIGITDHDYKNIEMPFELRKSFVVDEFKPFIDEGIVTVLKQDQRTYKFLTSLDVKIDIIIIGEDEWADLKAGNWHYSDKILDTWKIEVEKRSDGISSTKVRELIKAGCSYKDVESMITEDVYIKTRDFYYDKRR